MRISRFLLLLTLSALVLFWMACDGHGAGFSTIGRGNTATYLLFTDNTRINVQSINTDGTLTSILGSPYTAGTQPSSILVAPNGKFIYVLNSGSNSITQFSIATDGTLTKVGNDVQTGTLPVAIAMDSQQRYLAVANKTSGNVSFYRVDSTSGTLTEFGFSPITTGNTHIAVTIQNNNVYAVGGTSIAEIAVDATNFTTAVASGSPFAAGSVGTLTGAVAGTQLYALDGTNNQVQNYTLDLTTGAPTLGTSIASGTQPVAALAVLSDKFLYVANKGSNNVSAYSIDSSSGALTAIAGSPFSAGTGPALLAFDPVNNFLIVGNPGSLNVSVYSVNATTGVLTLSTTPSLGTAGTGVAVAKP
jgi:DNA-binding beta-propeller fold protein YncE